MATLDVELLKRFPGFTLDVHWRAEGGTVALFGPSGAGKTVTLQCLAGLMRPDSGCVQVAGRTLYDSVKGADLPPRDRRLGSVLQGFALFPHLTVEQNLAFGLDRLSPTARSRRTQEMVERLQLGEVRRLKPSALSGGQQQRLALGRALAPDPDLLLLDEPLAALDGPLRRILREELATSLRGFGKMAVVVTHDLPEACQLADQLVVYDRGRVVQSGPKHEVINHPVSTAVATALGVRNVLEGAVLQSGPEEVQIVWRGHLLVASYEHGDGGAPLQGTSVAFFIRPEHVQLMRKDRFGAEGERRTNRIAGIIVDEVDMGATVSLRFLADAKSEPPARGYDLEIEVSRLVHEKLCVHYDRRWEVTIQPGAIQLFPNGLPGAQGLAQVQPEGS
jgi:ABC-type sulfate/molybdate transport systems ATPase subunit